MKKSLTSWCFAANEKRKRGMSAGRRLVLMGLVILCTVLCVRIGADRLTAQAAPGDRIRDGVTAGGVDLSGMTQDQAAQAISDHVESLAKKKITLVSNDGGEITVTAGDLGMEWVNRDIAKEAAALGRTGNIVVRYKNMKDLTHRGMDYKLRLEFDRASIVKLLAECGARFNTEAAEAQLLLEDGVFTVVEGQNGQKVDEETTTVLLQEFLEEEWEGVDERIALIMHVEESRGATEDLLLVGDLLGSFTTSYTSSGTSRSKNVANGCNLVNATTVYPGESFSFYEAVRPFSEENGYYMAGSYLQGRVVDSLGGGICQVSTTLYNAVLKAELEVTERHNHSMIVNYVDPSADAAIAESAGKDFRFVNNLEYPIYIEGYTKDKHITFNIYGVETRPANRTVTYESVVLETKYPEADQIIADPAQPVGYITVSSEHIGYKAELYKVVKENGQQVSRELVNKSNYAVSPRTAVVGTATDSANVLAELNAAIASNNINIVKQTLANIKAVQDAIKALTPEEQAAIAAAQQAASDAAAGN